MSRHYDDVLRQLTREPRRWLITGVAGFIGSALLEALLELDQSVVGLDNFLTGRRSNLEDVRSRVAASKWERFSFVEGDIRVVADCERACRGSDIVLHQAALGSVPRSLKDPLLTHECNVNGMLNMLVAARDASVKRFVYAASSSTYGDSENLPKQEDVIGRPLSPYAVTKYVNELYAEVFGRCYEMSTIGLRYFNVFGRRQDPEGAYAAVIPRWFSSLIKGEPVYINGDGQTSRDFSHVENVVQANLLAACGSKVSANRVYNIAVGQRTTLTELFGMIRELVHEKTHADLAQPVYGEFRAGDVRHSQADISRARQELGYWPTKDVRAGLAEAAEWYLGTVVT